MSENHDENQNQNQNQNPTPPPPSPLPEPNITNFTLNETITDTNTRIVNQQGRSADGTEITKTTFDTTNAPDTVIIEKLLETVEINYDDETNTQNGDLVQQIRQYASQIKCENFHGKGTIDDYNALFVAASNIANEAQQMQLDVDIEGFNDFGQAADQLSNLFNGFIVKLQNVNIINDTTFLQAVVSALGKIVNLSNVFGKFKETILMTSTIKIPKSVHDTKIILDGVMDELNCAMNYITNFVTPDANLTNGQLSVDDRNVLNKAVTTIENWNTLCQQGVSIAMANDTDIIGIKSTNNSLKAKTQNLQNVTNLLQAKLNQYKLNN